MSIPFSGEKKNGAYVIEMDKPQFAILRFEKLKTWAAVKKAGDHNARLRPVPNAKVGGDFTVSGGEDAAATLRAKFEKFGVKPRRNSVLAISAVLTASPEYFTDRFGEREPKKLQAMREAVIAFAVKEFGKARLVQVAEHLDETTPHWHLIIAPLKERNRKGVSQVVLACRDFIGSPDKLRAFQDRFAGACEALGLVRGVKGSNATHKRLTAFYGSMEGIQAQAEAKEAKIGGLLLDLEAVASSMTSDQKAKAAKVAEGFDWRKKRTEHAAKRRNAALSRE